MELQEGLDLDCEFEIPQSSALTSLVNKALSAKYANQVKLAYLTV